MSLLLESSETRVGTLEELVQILDGYGPGLNEDTVLECKDPFQAFLNDPSAFSEFLARQISAGQFQLRNPWVPSSFVLHYGKEYTIRANVWNPPVDAANPRDWEDTLYSYKCAHDHNFAFLTGGYYGPGYRTERYEYDPEECRHLKPGDVPRTLRELGQAWLPKGSMMLYRESRDIHVQHYPTGPSVSVNILLAGRRDNPQIVFKDDHRTVDRMLTGETRIPEMLAKVEGLLDTRQRGDADAGIAASFALSGFPF